MRKWSSKLCVRNFDETLWGTAGAVGAGRKRVQIEKKQNLEKKGNDGKEERKKGERRGGERERSWGLRMGQKKWRGLGEGRKEGMS